jgi:hypothetical protein
MHVEQGGANAPRKPSTALCHAARRDRRDTTELDYLRSQASSGHLVVTYPQNIGAPISNVTYLDTKIWLSSGTSTTIGSLVKPNRPSADPLIRRIAGPIEARYTTIAGSLHSSVDFADVSYVWQPLLLRLPALVE